MDEARAEAPRWLLGMRGGATGASCCRGHVSERARLVNLEVRERAAGSCFSSVRVSRRRQDVRRMRATARQRHAAASCAWRRLLVLLQHVRETSTAFQMCHVA